MLPQPRADLKPNTPEYERIPRHLQARVIGALAAVDTALVVKVLSPIWQTKTETATRLRGRIESVLDWATVSKYRQGDNPARWRGHLDNLLADPSRSKRTVHHPALPWQEVGAFMAALRKQEGIAAKAVELAILTACRSGEVRLAAWAEFDLEAALWVIPAERMKAKREHRVPLSAAALAEGFWLQAATSAASARTARILWLAGMGTPRGWVGAVRDGSVRIEPRTPRA